MVLQQKVMTAEEFEIFAQLPENANRLLEFIGGRIVEVVSNGRSSELGAIMVGFLTNFVYPNKLGRVTGADGGYRVMGERYIPDAAFISKKRQPVPSLEAYNPSPPDLAVEVLSPSNDESEMRKKIVNYLLAGTMVLVLDSDRKEVEIYAPGKSPLTVGMDGFIDGGDVLLGFQVAVKDIFIE